MFRVAEPEAGCSVLLTEFLRTSGLLYCWLDDVELTAETFA